MSASAAVAPRPTAPALLVIGAAIGSVLPSWAHLPIPLYAPVERTLRLAAIGASGGPPIEITYYGTYLCAALAAGLGACIGVFVDRRGNSPHPLLPAWTLTALGVATGFQLWSVWP